MRFGSSVQIVLALILACVASVVTAEETTRARYLGSYPWTMDKPWFGGWSGIEVSADGRQMTVISDRGLFLRARIERDGDLITHIPPGSMWRLKSSTGAFLTPKIDDSEGLAVAADGTVYISFEDVTRVSRYTQPDMRSQALRRPRNFRGFARNKSLEALAIDGNGRLFTTPERVENDNSMLVYMLDGDVWTIPFSLAGGQGFLPVGADFGPDGRFYLLERAWSALGFRARVRRWDIIDDNPVNEELLLETSFGTHDNLEGLAIWRDEHGRTRLTMIADDNFLALQRTEIVEYVIGE